MRERQDAHAYDQWCDRIHGCNHEALKQDDAAWDSLPLLGMQRTYDEPGEPTHLEMKNCPACDSTLCKPVFLTITEAA